MAVLSCAMRDLRFPIFDEDGERVRNLGLKRIVLFFHLLLLLTVPTACMLVRKVGKVAAAPLSFLTCLPTWVGSLCHT
jgi:hypothetical protein